MLLNETRDPISSHAAVPGSFGIDEHGWSVAANTEAADFGAIASLGSRGEVVVLDLLFQGFPGSEADFRRATTWTRA